ncbi:unnamed protein product [Microthlaspi erraticum]|uniref:F-box associated beta-propeller type 3 domain-containing protein n=1 Tax=Microthlaspi erraticum TaxID=1685480 RepID=A0A6D2ILU2_9BRAS|nr:unnamed protein product [Microthlaspi erraticum]
MFGQKHSSLSIKNSTMKEDVEKGELSTNQYNLQDDKLSKPYSQISTIRVAGVTAAGDIVLSMGYTGVTSTPFYVFYFNPEKKTLQSIEVQGFGDVFGRNNDVEVFVDHVEDHKFNITKTRYAATSISQPERKPKPTSISTSHEAQLQQDGGTFDALCLLDDH